MKNRGIDWEREVAEQSGDDWLFSAGSTPCIALIPGPEAQSYLPPGELQAGLEDFMDCASRAPDNTLEAKLTYLLVNDKLSRGTEKFFEKHRFAANDRVVVSDRFVAINSGTTRQGNSLKAPLEAIRKHGLIPKWMLPARADMTFDEYHDKRAITTEMRRIGKEFSERVIINYERLAANFFASTEDLVVCAGYAWPNPVDGVYPRVEMQPNHAYVIFGRNPKYDIFDNYPEEENTDFIKRLAPDYLFADYGYRVYVSREGEPARKPSGFLGFLEALFSWIR